MVSSTEMVKQRKNVLRHLQVFLFPVCGLKYVFTTLFLIILFWSAKKWFYIKDNLGKFKMHIFKLWFPPFLKEKSSKPNWFCVKKCLPSKHNSQLLSSICKNWLEIISITDERISFHIVLIQPNFCFFQTWRVYLKFCHII